MMNIKVLKDCAEVSYKKPGTDKKQIKLVSLSDVPALFDTKISFDSGPMPIFGRENAYGVHRIIKRDTKTIFLIQGINPHLDILHTRGTTLTKEEREEMDLNHIEWDGKRKPYTKIDDNSHKYEGIYLPNLLMSLSLKDEGSQVVVERSGILAYKDPFITEDTKLYDFPFSNTYKGNVTGQICWGGHRIRLDQMSQAVGVISSFLDGVMNHHLFNSFNIKGKTVQCSSKMLAYLAERSKELESYPYDDMKLNKNTDYKSLVNYLKQNWK